jgi:hypothetical protein
MLGFGFWVVGAGFWVVGVYLNAGFFPSENGLYPQ